MSRVIKMSLALSAVCLIGLIVTAESHAQWFNPVIGGSPRYVTGAYYSPWTGWNVNTNRNVVRASATNPWRGVALPGSQRYVNYTTIDAVGRPVNVRGWTWRSVNGVGHGNIRRTTTNFTPSGAVNNSTTTYFHKRR